jgi:hypothetical protein
MRMTSIKAEAADVMRRTQSNDINFRPLANERPLPFFLLAAALLSPTAFASTLVAWGETSRPPGSPPSMTTNIPPGLVDAIAVAGGLDVGYAIKSNGTIVTWGNPLTPSLTAVPAGLTDAISIVSGTQHTLAVRRNGTVVGWGDAAYSKTAAPALLDRVMTVAAGDYHSVGLRRNGTVVAWGDYTYGHATAVPAGLNDAVAIVAAHNYGLALRRNGTVVAWGGTYSPTNVSAVVVVPQDLSNVVAIAGSVFAGFALRDDGTVYQWGTAPIGPVAGLTKICAISVSVSSGVLALKEDGTLVKTQPLLSPIPTGISNVVAIGGVGTPSVVLIRSPDEPSITQHPQTQTVTAGAPASFHVGAVAGQPVTYQWQFNGINLRGATQDTLQINSAWPAQAGHYRALVTAAGLTITSRPALLKITKP